MRNLYVPQVNWFHPQVNLFPSRGIFMTLFSLHVGYFYVFELDPLPYTTQRQLHEKTQVNDCFRTFRITASFLSKASKDKVTL